MAGNCRRPTTHEANAWAAAATAYHSNHLHQAAPRISRPQSNALPPGGHLPGAAEVGYDGIVDSTRHPSASSFAPSFHVPYFGRMSHSPPPSPPPSMQLGNAISSSSSASFQDLQVEKLPDKKIPVRRRAPPDAKWEQHKETIHGLYINDGLTLGKTMEVMKEYGLYASRTVFAEKLSSWKFSKNVKKKDVYEIVQKISQRDPQKTEVLKGGRKVILGGIQKRYERWYLSFNVNRYCFTEPSAPSAKTPAVDKGWQETPILEPLGIDSRSLTLVELLCRREAARGLLEEGSPADAASSLLTVLCGLRCELGPRHCLSLSTSYAAADAYIQSGQDEKAFQILDWVSKGHSEAVGLWSLDSLRHYLRVAEMLQGLHQPVRAKTLAFNLYHAIRDGWESDCGKFIPVPRLAVPEKTSLQSHAGTLSLEIDIIDRVISNSTQDTALEQWTAIMRLWTVAGVPGILPAVKRLMELGSGESPSHQEELRLRARLQNSQGRAAASIRGSGKWATLSNVSMALPWHLSAAVELASLHFDCNNHDRGLRVLEWTAAHLGQPLEPTKTTIGYSLATACLLNERFYIEEALPWLERALATSTRPNGPTSALSPHIQDALGRQRALIKPHTLGQQPSGKSRGIFEFWDLSWELLRLVDADRFDLKIPTSMWRPHGPSSG
ncbi:hypothetical protein GGTG_12240 [Gaeumannomyces tritici R3-111a-1]|uniref:Clr5 domain-containing protein n=1 Tax=Gaeumannomyces tritici (strain R3-111a-1) TaxID=644352 RepID=J3PFG5_GAET3|nr:hypothetical protein GGTG_12240 [Gaeumannomyces tritici R3-111a-1]EJT70067.1 hypothetical protein GGTG_12240 [Gaeumannomyces tritici R3-111a-1]